MNPRRLLAGLAALTAGLLAPTVTTSGAAAASAAPDPALERIAACTRSQNHLLVAILMDESGSLRTTDPNGERVAAATVAIRNFATLAALSVDGETPLIEVQVAGFSSGYEVVVPWTRLDDGSVDSIGEAIEAFADEDDGLDTDFPTALLGAQRDLASKTAAVTADGAAPPCKALLLFTDGRYDIEERNTEARRAAGLEKEYAPGLPLDVPGNADRVETEGRAFLCDADGLADQLRGDDVVIITIALAAQIAPEDQDFLRRVSTGNAGAERCGRRQASDNGTYLPSSELGDLVVLFDRVTNEIGGGTELPGEGRETVPVCPQTACAEGRREFDVDRLLRRFHLLADLGGDGIVVELEAPGGTDTLVLEPGVPGTAHLGSAALRWAWVSGEALMVDAELPSDRDDWVGTWAVTFVDRTGEHPDAVARSQIFLYGGWSAKPADDAVFRRGEHNTLAVAVVDHRGQQVDIEDVPGDIRLDLDVRGSGSDDSTPLSSQRVDGGFEATYDTPLDFRASVARLTIRLHVRTRAGIELRPSTKQFTIPVETPPSYPAISPEELRLNSVRGTGTTTGTLVVTGAAQAAGCVWFSEPRFDTFPSEAGSLQSELEPFPRSADRCREVRPGEEIEIRVQVSPAATGEGSAEGSLSAFLSSETGEEVLQVDIPIGLDLARPINQAKRLGLFLGILLPGIILPILVLWLANFALARFRTEAVRVARVPVRVGDSAVEQVARDGWARAVSPGADDFQYLVTNGDGSRRFELHGLDFRARVPVNPFAEPYGLADCGDRQVCGSSGTRTRRHRVRGMVPLALPGAWCFVRHDAGDPASPGSVGGSEDGNGRHGDLVVFVTDGPLEPQLERLREDVGTRLPGLVGALPEQSRPPDPPDVSDPGGPEEPPKPEPPVTRPPSY